MPSHTFSQSSLSRLVLLLLLLLGSPAIASATTSYLVGVPSFSRDFVLAGDSQDPARTGVAVSMSAFISTTSSDLANYRFAWQLQVQAPNGSWSQVNLSGANTVFSPSEAVFISTDPNHDVPSSILITKTGALQPEQTLNPYANYRIEGRLQRQPLFGTYADVASPRTNTARRLYQFTNTTSGDNARNVIATVDTVTLNNPFLLQNATTVADRSFTVDIGATARRWNNYNLSPAHSSVTFRYQVELRDANTGAVIPVASPSISRSRTILTYDNSGPLPIPSTVPFTETLPIHPLQQLDPVNGLYEVSIAISHIEETSPSQVVKTGNTRNLPNLQLFHFNSTLNFSGIGTVLKTFTRSPPPTTSTSPGNHVSMTLGGVAGHLSPQTGYTFTAPGSVTLRLFSDGTAAVQTVGATIPVTPPSSPDLGSVAQVRFVRTDLRLNSSGLSANLLVYLPQGMGYSTDPNSRTIAGTLNFGPRTLNNQLQPALSSAIFNASPLIHVVEETKPASIAASRIIWSTQTGQFTLESPGTARYVRADETDFLRGSPLPEEDRIKANNAGYYSALQGIGGNSFSVQTAGDASAKLSAEFLFGNGEFKTHFPHGTDVFFSHGGLTVAQDAVTGGQLNDVAPLVTHYQQNCPDGDCDDLNEMTGRFIVNVSGLQFTPDGGLVGSGGLLEEEAGDRTLRWGYIEALSASQPTYAHSIDGFGQGTFHLTGHFIPGGGGGSSAFLPGASGTAAAEFGPGAIHLSAVLDPQDLARPGSPADRAGNHYYAGVNLKVATQDPFLALATIAGQTVSYQPRSCNKFYARQVGVTGTLEAVPGSFPKEMKLSGYFFTFDYYGLGFLDSVTSPQRSFTPGSIRVEYPSNETFEFEGLSFTCLGALDSARLPQGGLEKRLDYWNADIEVASLDFVTSNSCNPKTDSFAVLGVSAFSTLIAQPLHGLIGIRPDGQLIHRAFSQANALQPEVTSRLRLPNRIEMDGPHDEIYQLTAISDAYFNDHAQANPGETASGQGRLNFAAKVGVPFFEDLSAHVRTTASKNFNPDATLHLMGGWAETGQTYFNSTFFDPSHRAFPPNVAAALYRNESGASGDPRPYLIEARQSWLNVVNLNYPLAWSSSLRSFTAFEPTREENLLIVQIDHQLEYLSADNAEISFGAVYDGLPRLNLTNFVFNKIDQGTGVLQAITEALQAEAVGALAGGLDSMETLLNDRVDALLDGFLSQTIDPIIDQLYNGLDPVAAGIADINTWKNHVQNQTTLYLINNVGTTSANVRFAIGQMSQAVGDASSLIHRVDTSLNEVQIALRAIHSEIYKVGGGVSLDPPAVPDPSAVISGLLSQQGDQFPIVQNLISGLIAEVAGDIGGELAGSLSSILEEATAELDSLINEQIDKVRPTLERLITVIAKLDHRIGQARLQLAAGGDFFEELDAILSAADGQVVAATNRLQEVIEEFVLADIPSPDQFIEFTANEVKQRIRQEIQDELRQLAFIREYQLVLRQRLYDLDLAIKEGIDTAFAQINTTLKNLLQGYLAQFDDTINGLLGDLDSVVGAGQLDGFAHITGDALRLLRIDASLQLKVPDDMEFKGYIQIKQLRSDGTGTCSYGPAGTLSTEITLGAFGVPVSWISPGMKLDVDGKVTFTDRPVGLGGRIEMVEGEFGFEAFTVTELGAAMSFGATENYLAAKVGLVFQSYSVYGGVFFGRTCTLDPLKMVNAQVAGILGQPPFTGAYVYGEAHIPVSEALLGIPASCMFKITAGVGAGAFYFVEGPTFGGQIFLAVSGEALCLVSIKGDLSLVGVKVADDLRFSGRGRLSGRVGSCPFCVKFGKSLQLEYANDRWSFEL